jgi:cobalt-zinc-cadmium efflux system protein
MPHVVEVHDLHVWEVTTEFPTLSAHVLVEPASRLPSASAASSNSCCRTASGSITRRSRSITAPASLVQIR